MRGEVCASDNGRAAITPSDPIIAGTRGHWSITYTAGAKGVSTGGTVRFEIPYGFTAPQLHWRDAPGYTTYECSRDDVELKLSLDKPFENDAYVTRWGRHVFVTVIRGTLQQGDTITLHYGQWIAGGRYLASEVPNFAGQFEFTVATDCEGKHEGPFSGFYLIEKSPTLQVVGAEPASVHIIGPSQAEPGRPFAVKALALDGSKNVASLQELKIHLVDQLGRPLTDWQTLAPGKASESMLALKEVGPHLIEAQDCDGQTLGALPLLCAVDHPYRVFWGDLHSHTVLSDGLGTVDDYMHFARDVAGLDFCAIGDHSQYLSDADWETIQEATRRYNEPGRFTTLLAYEYSHNPRGLPYYGDKVVVFPGDKAPLLRATTDLTKRQYTDLAEIGPRWRELGAILTIHCHARGTTSYYDPELVRLLEIYSIWGSAEREGAVRQLLPSQAQDFRGQFAVDALNAGYKVGFIGSGDEHAGHPGLGSWLRIWEAYPAGITAVLATANTRENIWEALWNRRCYATSGARIFLHFAINGHLMGSIIKNSEQPVNIEASVIGTDRIKEITIVRNGEDFYSESATGHFAHLSLQDVPPKGGAYYYLRVVQADDEQAWASPIWVEE